MREREGWRAAGPYSVSIIKGPDMSMIYITSERPLVENYMNGVWKRAWPIDI